MYKQWLLVLFISPVMSLSTACPLGVVSCSTQAVGADSCCTPTNGLFVLVQQWRIDLGPADQFTLHGLWPDTCSGEQTGDIGCDLSRAYKNITAIISSSDHGNSYGADPMITQMNTYWPSYTGDDNYFWSHEWAKHGTCVSTLEPQCYGPEYKRYQEVVDYFQTALFLRAKYNLYKALADSEIEPSDDEEHQVDNFKKAIKDQLGIEVAVKCKGDFLNEIWTWFNVKNVIDYVPAETALGRDTCKLAFRYPPKE